MKHTTNDHVQHTPHFIQSLHLNWFGDDKCKHAVAACLDGFFSFLSHARFRRCDYGLQYSFLYRTPGRESGYPLSPHGIEQSGKFERIRCVCVCLLFIPLVLAIWSHVTMTVGTEDPPLREISTSPMACHLDTGRWIRKRIPLLSSSTPTAAPREIDNFGYRDSLYR